MCEFTPYPDEDEESWHFLRICPNCLHETWTLHCVHEAPRSCGECGFVSGGVDDDLDYATAEGRKAFLSLYGKEITE